MSYNDKRENSLIEFVEESCLTTIAVLLFAILSVIFVFSNVIGIGMPYSYLGKIFAILLTIFVLDQIFKKLFWPRYVDKQIEKIDRESL